MLGGSHHFPRPHQRSVQDQHQDGRAGFLAPVQGSDWSDSLNVTEASCRREYQYRRHLAAVKFDYRSLLGEGVQVKR